MKKVYIILCLVSGVVFGQSGKVIKKSSALKVALDAEVESRSKLAQVMVDKLFSFSELGFQEYQTMEYITALLEKEGFTINRGISGIPTSWSATWGQGSPVIALGSDVDGIPKASQKPGVAYHDPLVKGAPGHGEGHNSGVPLNIVAALSLKEVMTENDLSGTLILWPGVAEEQLGSKAYYSRDGFFKNVDACIFTHVSSNMTVTWGQASGTGLVSVEYTFSGESSHSAGAPWRGKSALDGVELMNVGWNYMREHLHPSQRSHYVVKDGGDQPNVVPSSASVWYYFRGLTYQQIKELHQTADRIAEGAALMSNTTVSQRILGSAWPRHFNKPIALAMNENIKAVGLPQWSEQDQMLAKALQKEVGSHEDGLDLVLEKFQGPPSTPVSGGSDDIGDVSWTVPTVTLRYPANIPNLQGHHWSNAVAMATPIAHKGTVQGAKVVARTLLDLILNPDILIQAKSYFAEQTKEQQYIPLISKEDVPPTYLNKEIMEEFLPELSRFYYDETKYENYLQQLGISYPTIKK